jgi:transposase
MMDILHPHVCGIDVHAKFAVACCRHIGSTGTVTKTSRTVGTMTDDLQALAAWLRAAGVTHVAIESTGVLWQPVWNILEEHVTVVLVNPRDVRQVPGRKTDVTDAEWLAQLLQYGLLRNSFVPPAAIRELRDLTRGRAKLVDQTTAIANRIHAVLHDANIKLGSVASDILGVSGRAMLQAIVAGESDPERLADLARRSVRKKIPALRRALAGRITPHHRFLLRRLLGQLAFLESEIAVYDERIAEASRPFAATLARLDTIPGVNQRTAENLLAELGPDMQPFPTSGHVASWVAICPGNHETGGKQQKGTTRHGNRWARRALTEAAWAAKQTRGTYAAAQFRRLVGRRGKKRAIVAVAHSLLVAAYYIIRDEVTYRDLGPVHFERLAPTQLTHYLVKRLERLGHKVTLEAAA